MKLVITGGFGFIGSRLAALLTSKGHEVVILEHPDARPPEGFPECPVLRGDITRFETLETLSVPGVDAILHLAAQSSGPRSFHIPDIDITLNVLGTLNVIKWCKAIGAKRILFASSFVVYGDHPGKEALSETDPCAPKSVYGVSKLAGEHLLRVYAEPLGIRWNALRMFNVFGIGQDITRPDQGVVGIFINFVKNGNSVPVNGSLERFRDLVYIDDVLHAWELCVLDDAHPNRAYNVGSGLKTTFGDLIRYIIKSAGKDGLVEVRQSGVTTPGDMMGCYSDNSRISAELGYAPRTSPAAGVERMVAWALSDQPVRGADLLEGSPRR